MVWIVLIIVGVFFVIDVGKLVVVYFYLVMILVWIVGYVGFFWLVK